MPTFLDFWRSLPPDGKDKLALETKYSKAYLSQVANGYRRGSHEVAKAIEFATHKRVKRSDVRPDIYD